jgi:hypothetical protein
MFAVNVRVHAVEKKRKDKSMPFGVNLMRSQVLYQAAQNTCHIYAGGVKNLSDQWQQYRSREGRGCSTMDVWVCAIIQDAPHSRQLPLEALMLRHEGHILLLQLAGVLLPCLQLQHASRAVTLSTCPQRFSLLAQHVLSDSATMPAPWTPHMSELLQLQVSQD